MITVATLFWTPNEASLPFSRAYTEAWVDKLFRGFKRNLTRPFRFVCFVDVQRDFAEAEIEQETIGVRRPNYGHCIEPYRLDDPMILVGLDTVVTGNIDHLADYCLTAHELAVPRDPFFPNTVCNGVALVPAGMRHSMYDMHSGQNDMEWVRSKDPAVIDDLFPGHVVSYKGHVKEHGLGDARIVYFHGEEKPGEINEAFVREHWR